MSISTIIGSIGTRALSCPGDFLPNRLYAFKCQLEHSSDGRGRIFRPKKEGLKMQTSLDTNNIMHLLSPRLN